MTLNDLLDNEPSILAQDGDIGIPSYEELRQSPNTRWVDSYINSQGQKDGGFFGSIPEYDESFFPKKKIEPFVFNPNPPYMMSMSDGEPEAEQEESPIVLEGGVEENVYLPEEDAEQEPEPSVYIPDEEEPEERQKTPYELSDNDLIDILQSIIKSRTSSSIEQEQPLFDDSFPTIHQTNTAYTPPVSLPQIQTSLSQEELKQMYEKLLEELRKMLAKYKGLSVGATLLNVGSKAPIYSQENITANEQGTVTGGASRVNNMNAKEKIQEFAYEKGLSKLFPMSSDATMNGMHDMEAAKNDKAATVTQGLDAVESFKNKEYLKSMGAKDTDNGVIYNEHSDIANNFKNSPELEAHLVKIKDDVLQGKQLQDTKITFESSKNDFLKNNEKIDRHAFIHDAMLVDQKVDDNGIYTAKILDYSNFDDKPIEKLLDIPNKWGYDMQERGLYKNYYIVIDIRKKVNW